MKKLASVLLILAAGCGSQADNGNVQSAIQEDLLSGLQANSAATEETRTKALIVKAMATAIPDAESARYRNIRAGVGGAACGEVASAAASAPFRPFVVTPEAAAIVGTAPDIKFNDPTDFLADAWVRWCATPEELKQVAAELAKTPSHSADDIIPAARNGMAVAAPEPAAAEPAPETKIDSFAASVRRPQ
jgi:hypothetical protein